MSKTKARIYLLAMVVIAIMIGTIYYVYFLEKDTIITEGTLVENSMEEQGASRESIYQNRT